MCNIECGNSYPEDFIEWIGKYKIKKQIISGVEKWYSGNSYWQFDNIEQMFDFYCENYR